MLSLLEVLQRTERFFAENGVPNARLDAELILAHCLGVKRLDLYLQFDRPLEEAQLASMRPLVKRRSAREPLQYVLGATDFCGLRLKTDRRALIPRPETEGLVEAVQERLQSPPQRILDLGTGSGAIALALAQSYPDARVVAVESRAEALELAAENARDHALDARVTFKQGHWLGALDPGDRFDCIVSNPPYLSHDEMGSAAVEVIAHEPHAALLAEEEGTRDLNEILRTAIGHLTAHGLLALETGIGHLEVLSTLAAEAGYASFSGQADLSGRQRYFFASSA